jgi:class 3 adenylate cyclase
METRTGYAKSGDAHLAYAVTGQGAVDILVMSSLLLPIDASDEEPHLARFNRRLASFGRVIRYDARGVGTSDPGNLAGPLTPEAAAADALAVLDATGSESAAVFASAGSALTAVWLAAKFPARVSALVIVNGYARMAQDDDYPIGHPRDLIEGFLRDNLDPDAEWTAGGNDDVAWQAPSLAHDARFRDWWRRAVRRGASPQTARWFLRMWSYGDVRALLPEVSVPALVVHRAHNGFVPARLGRYLGEHIPTAKYLELPGADQVEFAGDVDTLLDEIEEFLTGQRHGSADRVLATILVSDIVDSTARAVELGDTAWRAELDLHDAMVRTELGRHDGREVNTTGDGFIASFESPTMAARGAKAIVAASDAAGLPVRVGIHTGECERRGSDLAGLTVHIAARVAAHAGRGEVLVSRTVKDLVTGSELRFADRGEHELRGVPDPWHLYALES